MFRRNERHGIRQQHGGFLPFGICQQVPEKPFAKPQGVHPQAEILFGKRVPVCVQSGAAGNHNGRVGNPFLPAGGLCQRVFARLIPDNAENVRLSVAAGGRSLCGQQQLMNYFIGNPARFIGSRGAPVQYGIQNPQKASPPCIDAVILPYRAS